MIHRSNQFNLTTRRRSTAEVQALIEDDALGDPYRLPARSVRRQRPDQRGAGAGSSGDVLDIDTWLMSCRVLKRGVEAFLLNHLATLARARGLAALRGEYLPTAKNGLVRDHYAKLGFTQLREDESGRTVWIFRLDDGWTPLPTLITETRRDGLDAH